MGKHYSESVIEVFHVNAVEFAQAEDSMWHAGYADNLPTVDCTTLEGWYWWSCFPGGLPDSDPFGPFDTEAAALADAQEMGV